MITGALLSSLFLLLTFAINFLPASSGLPSSISTNLTWLINQALSWQYFFPVSTAFTVLGLFLGWEFILYTWKGIRWIISLFRGVKA